MATKFVVVWKALDDHMERCAKLLDSFNEAVAVAKTAVGFTGGHPTYDPECTYEAEEWFLEPNGEGRHRFGDMAGTEGSIFAFEV